MAEMRIEVPGEDRFVTTEEAARWLRISDDSFEKLAKRHGVPPIKGAKGSLWDRFGVAALGYLMQFRAESSTDDADETKTKKS